MINAKYPRRGFVVEEVTEGCKTEGCSVKKLVVVPWEYYGEHDFNELTEGITVGQNTCDDDNEGECQKCGKPVYFKRHFIVTSDASTIKTAEDALNYAVDVLNAPFPLGEAFIATHAEYSYYYAENVLHAPFPLGEKAIATDAYYYKEYKKLFPEPQETPEPTKISNPISNLISEEVITETFAALKAANVEEVTVSFSSDSDGCQPVDWIKFEFNEQGVKDLIKNKNSRKDTSIRENLDLDDPNWHLEVYEYHFEEANIPNLKCTKELWNILVSFVYKEYETLDNKAGGYVIWRRNLVILDACENVKLRNSDPWEQIPLFASGKYVRQYGSPEPAPEPQVVAKPQAPAPAMSDKQKEAIKYSFDNLLYSLGEWIDFDKHGGVPSCFCPESIMRNIDHLLEAFPDICKDLAVKKYSEVKSYMDEYSKDRDEKENRV